MKIWHGFVAAGLAAGLVVFVEPLLGEVGYGQSSHSHLPSGFRAVRSLAQAEGYTPRVWRGMPEQLSGVGGALVLFAPIDALFAQTGYQEDLQTWIEAGNTVLLTPRRFETEMSELLNRKVENRVANYASGESVTDWLEGLGLTDDLNLYERADRVASLEFSAGPRLAVHLESELSPSTVKHSDDWQKIARIGGDPMAFSRSLGKGKLVYWQSASMFDNWSIGQHGNAAAALHLFGLLNSNSLLFDEFFHGLAPVGGFRQLLASSRVWPATVLGLILLSLVVWSALVRSTSLQVEPLPSRRSKEEHLRAMGDLLCNGREGSWLAEQLIQGVRAALIEELGLPSQSSDEEISQRLAMRDAERAQVFSRSAKQFADLRADGHQGLQTRQLMRWANLLMTVLPKRATASPVEPVSFSTQYETNT